MVCLSALHTFFPGISFYKILTSFSNILRTCLWLWTNFSYELLNLFQTEFVSKIYQFYDNANNSPVLNIFIHWVIENKCNKMQNLLWIQAFDKLPVLVKVQIIVRTKFIYFLHFKFLQSRITCKTFWVLISLCLIVMVLIFIHWWKISQNKSLNSKIACATWVGGGGHVAWTDSIMHVPLFKLILDSIVNTTGQAFLERLISYTA